MKHHLLIGVLILMFVASPADAAHKLQIFSDVGLSETSIADNTQRTVDLYVVYSGFLGATGLRFSVKPGLGFTGVWLGDTSSFFTLGSSQTDISISFTSCLPPPILVLTMRYQLFGTSTACSELRTAPPDGFPFAIAGDTDCFFAELPIRDLQSLHVNCPVAIEPSTWGRVKALYR